MDNLEAYSLFKLDKLGGEKIVSLADEWLSRGVYSETIDEIYTSKDKSLACLGPLFEKVMSELRINEPNRYEAASYITKVFFNRALDGSIPVDEVASFIYWEVQHEITDEYPDKEYVGDNLQLEKVFCWLRELWDCRDGSMILYHTDIPRSEAEQKFKEHILEEMRSWGGRSKFCVSIIS